MTVMTQGGQPPPSTTGLRVGDTITIRPCFGMAEPTEVIVTGLEFTKETRSKYGMAVQSIPWAMVIANRVLIEYADHWCYSEQVILPRWRP
ncbi:MAG: hypothetical protein V3V08_07310 [Nannocystaceae bacterium]